ncbi:rhodanese-like domain-containing protein [Pasteurella skyensis]|uniref:Rhodanese-like domain-containing protein n=1 Tax=Phocoenobacter skyensis TaxID=97481 RepID=A0AAJ6P163_9PAST|nr:rhodanese-like domain-containing protein [Pasteurella skyensis]MDP8163166.1 rhodanese-like domain-containing protein [Pasteurella skyensis]MDP8173359.1 rhodanese-like domain-containing protein [Pasteurella skyensis]MDP8177772.1 rhodanese-like domain-containing protein [Pasteurella skyensis]MDP8179549.1 rhodanese-like domain-containing protein [Pasteurella skyensis]MDP8182479.1 rhodanese-like domain-containing protein [Pasteurella skyensis]
MELTFIQEIQQFTTNHTIMVVAWFGLFIALMVNIYQGLTSKFKIIANAEATRLINKEDGVVLDLRSDDDFKAGHIIDSLHLLPSDIKNKNIHRIEKYKTKPIILVDGNGMTSNSSAKLLIEQGFEKVYVLKEGMNAWRAEKLPLIKKHK